MNLGEPQILIVRRGRQNIFNQIYNFEHNRPNAFDVMYYGDYEKQINEERTLPSEKYFPLKHSIVKKRDVIVLDAVRASETGTLNYDNSLLEYGRNHMLRNKLFREFPLSLKTNKVFCSEWLSDKQIAMGTKCNKLLIYNVASRILVTIPTLCSSSSDIPLQNESGIHALAINPSKTLLVTGGQHSNNVAVYSLPGFDPVCVGEGAHTDWIFDVKWLDDVFFVTGARDGTLALWHVNKNQTNVKHAFSYYFIKPVITSTCRNADKVRALDFKPLYDLTALSVNSYLHVWDMKTFQQKSSHKLPYHIDNVCLAHSDENHVYAVGSASHVTLLDDTSLKTVKKINTNLKGCSVRSLSFNGNLLTFGTGMGSVNFYDVKAAKYIEHEGRDITLQASKARGVINYSALNVLQDYMPAIYTHCYDSSGIRLFAAGGPLPLNLQGYYAALWQ